MKKTKFFFFGFGQSAKYFIKELILSKKNFSFSATNTKKTFSLNFSKKRFKSFKFNTDYFDKKLINELLKSDYILISIPPINKSDLVLKKFKEVAKNLMEFLILNLKF